VSERLYYAHPTAVVDAPTVIGEGTKIWHFCHVMGKAKLGAGCSLGQNVYIGNVTIGDNVKIQNNVSVYDGVVIEDHVFCGPSMVFTNVVNPRSEVVRKHEYRETRVRRGATIGANATIVCGATLGEYAFIAAGAVVRGDVPPLALMAGVPAVRIGWMCKCGIRLAAPVHPAAGLRVACAGCGAAYVEAKGLLAPA
jgi:UDP-2-acetamido-3-amino-2,3-dideoxy-glucuronate N-acetyltransferase